MSKLDMIKNCISEIKKIDESETFYSPLCEFSIDELKQFCKQRSEIMEGRLYEMHNGDVLYCNVEFVRELRYPYELELGQTIHIYPEHNSIIAKGIDLLVTEVHKKKKYPNKKWWQFWLKQEEDITGYNLTVL